MRRKSVGKGAEDGSRWTRRSGGKLKSCSEGSGSPRWEELEREGGRGKKPEATQPVLKWKKLTTGRWKRKKARSDPTKNRSGKVPR